MHAAGPVQGRHLQGVLEVKGAFCFQRLHAMGQGAIEAAGPAGALLIRALSFLRALLALPGEQGPALAALAPALEAGSAADAVPAGAATGPAAAGAPGAVRGAAGAGLREGQGQGEHHPRATRPGPGCACARRDRQTDSPARPAAGGGAASTGDLSS